ncbi:hypothetical protein K470DRAFT_255880 [Piedraia hortae CBS 480.64]|uniref:Uncharacterized protein n=1 Tax=Piedraia hortae CBS 480.64 TaxID=1314780 RepID=A0A6A7C6A0_9PEZI|nr:hypothetical protein K470DRAFT_255880 [Piedraia hortae CBS 480.64]
MPSDTFEYPSGLWIRSIKTSCEACWIQASPLARMQGTCITSQRYLLHYQLHPRFFPHRGFPSGSCHM